MSVWVPTKDVYCEVDASSTGSTGRFYCFEKKTIENVESNFNYDQLLYY